MAVKVLSGTSTKQIRLNRDLLIGGDPFVKGDVVEVSEEDARVIVDRLGRGEYVEPEAAPAPTKVPEKK